MPRPFGLLADLNDTDRNWTLRELDLVDPTTADEVRRRMGWPARHTAVEAPPVEDRPVVPSPFDLPAE